MSDREFKIELVKINFVIFGGVISGINLGLDYYAIHLALGMFLLGSTSLLQYLSLLPEFAIMSRSDTKNDIDEYNRKMNDWYILLGCSAYIFIMTGFSYPPLLSEIGNGAFLPFVFVLSMFSLRMWLLHHHPTKDTSRMDMIMMTLLAVLIILGAIASWRAI